MTGVPYHLIFYSLHAFRKYKRDFKIQEICFSRFNVDINLLLLIRNLQNIHVFLFRSNNDRRTGYRRRVWTCMKARKIMIPSVRELPWIVILGDTNPYVMSKQKMKQKHLIFHYVKTMLQMWYLLLFEQVILL